MQFIAKLLIINEVYNCLFLHYFTVYRVTNWAFRKLSLMKHCNDYYTRSVNKAIRVLNLTHFRQ